MKQFSEQICQWYLLNFRELPWRNTKETYKIWVSEIILQQTRVNQGLSYYLRFVKALPTVKALALASEDKVLKLWQGLGYYSRARNMHRAAKIVMNEYKGHFPSTYNELLLLPGIGPYTASAIASFAANRAHAVVDGNVMRVLSRYFLVEDAVDTSRGKKIIETLAAKVLNTKNAALHNQAIMELGALVCTPQPVCNKCPVNETCQALRKRKTHALPNKKMQIKIKNRYMVYFVFTNGKEMILRKRKDEDIWKGLYDFPCIDAENKWPAAKQVSLFINQTTGNKKIINIKKSGAGIHLLSHRKLHIKFMVIHIKKLPAIKNTLKTTVRSIKKFAFPKPVEKFLTHEKALKVDR